MNGAKRRRRMCIQMRGATRIDIPTAENGADGDADSPARRASCRHRLDDRRSPPVRGQREARRQAGSARGHRSARETILMM